MTKSIAPLSPAERANLTRNKTYRKIRNGILVIDCTSRNEEKCSEEDFLVEYLGILNHQLRADNKKEVEIDPRRVYGSKKLRELLSDPSYRTIHLGSHGWFDKKKDETYFDTIHGRLFSSDLKGLWKDKGSRDKPLLIVLSACCAGRADLIRTLSDEGCRYCIAPVKETNWEHAAIFSVFFYTYLFLRRNRPTTAFHKAIRNGPRLTGMWKMFDRGIEVPEPHRAYWPS